MIDFFLFLVFRDDANFLSCIPASNIFIEAVHFRNPSFNFLLLFVFSFFYLYLNAYCGILSSLLIFPSSSNIYCKCD